MYSSKFVTFVYFDIKKVFGISFKNEMINLTKMNNEMFNIANT
jgi:hypothetical protein